MLKLKGGPLETMFPDGTDAEYTLVDEKFAVSLMNKEYTGTWDGAKLVIEDTEAVKQP